MRQIALLALFGVAVAYSGCKSSAPAASSASAPTSQTVRRDPKVITRAEVEQATWATTAFDLVQRLRPGFLRVKGATNPSGAPQTPLVRLNNQELGDHGALRSILVGSVQEIRYYTASEATAKFGTRSGRPTIEVTTK